MNKHVTRLYDTIKPKNYALDLAPDLPSFSYQAKETISFELVKPARQLVFHGVDLEIQATNLNHEVRIMNYEFDKVEQTVTFELEEELIPGSYELDLEFTGSINDSLHGWYRSNYEQGGETKWLATTQFEPTAAREAFVCIDEPSAKATFDVTLRIDPELTAISNTEIVKTETSGGKKVLTFAQTPIMSSYLLAFLVGEFEYLETTNDEGVIVRVYTTPGKKEQGQFALDVAAKTLSFYKDYFGIAYPLTKLDMIAVPDFAAGAMENWGAVTYRETAILVDEENSSLATKQWAAMVVAHELAHQWFGNLVTMSWWTDLWLNEGFASWVEYLAVDHLFPEWQMWTQFVTDDYAHARDLDALNNTHPIEVEVHHPREIDEIFDAISYQKGASVIRMLHAYLGEADFKHGLHDYLTKFSYGNAVTADLWTALEAASGKPVSKIMGAWTSQPGHPVVWFNKEGDQLLVRQERHFADPRQADKAIHWPVPLQFVDNKQSYLLEESKMQIDQSDLVKPNPGQTGFYVVGYTPEWLASLEDELKSDKMSVADKFGVLTDSFDLIKAGKLDSVSGLKLIANLRTETDLAVWNGLLDGLGGIMGIADEQTSELLEKFGAWLGEDRLNQLDWEPVQGESHFDALLRPRLISLVGRANNEALATVRAMYAAMLDGQSINPDVRGAVYSLVARFGGTEEYEQLLELYHQTDLQEEQRRLLRALASFKQADLAQQTLELSLSDDVRAADSITPLLGIVMNRFTSEIGWQFIQDNWPEIVKRYGTGGHLLTYFPNAIGGAFSTTDNAKAVQAFFDAHPTEGIERKVKQAVERIELKAAWRERDLAAITEYLQDFLPQG